MKPGVNTDMLVYDYAVGGHEVEDVKLQVEAEFIPQLGSSEGDKWTRTDTLFGESQPRICTFVQHLTQV